MNNYCTNCGEMLEKGDLFCKKCNTPITKLPKNYRFRTKEQIEKRKKVFTIIAIVVACIIVFYLVQFIAKKILYLNLQNKYVEPYIKENFRTDNYNVEFDYTGKCIVSGNCYFDPVMGCEGGACSQYTFYTENDCKAYYYKVTINGEQKYITVIDLNKNKYAVEGKNMYGKDKKIESVGFDE